MADHEQQPYDAVLVPMAFRKGTTSVARLQSVFDASAGALGMPQGPPWPHVRECGGGNYLVTRSPDDSLLFPTWHSRAGEPRYDWEDQPNGVKLGRLKADG
jgi:hypothetical protein